MDSQPVGTTKVVPIPVCAAGQASSMLKTGLLQYRSGTEHRSTRKSMYLKKLNLEGQ